MVKGGLGTADGSRFCICCLPLVSINPTRCVHVPLIAYRYFWRLSPPRYDIHDNFFFMADAWKMDYGGHDSKFTGNLVYIFVFGTFIEMCNQPNQREHERCRSLNMILRLFFSPLAFGSVDHVRISNVHSITYRYPTSIRSHRSFINWVSSAADTTGTMMGKTASTCGRSCPITEPFILGTSASCQSH